MDYLLTGWELSSTANFLHSKELKAEFKEECFVENFVQDCFVPVSGRDSPAVETTPEWKEGGILNLKKSCLRLKLTARSSRTLKIIKFKGFQQLILPQISNSIRSGRYGFPL
jgi:hypothetical protein